MTSSSGNHGLACIDAMKKWVPLFPSSNACLSSFEYAYFRYGLKGRIIVPRMVSNAKRKNLFYLLETQNQRWALPSGRSSSWWAPTCSSTATIVWRPRCTAGAPQYWSTSFYFESFFSWIVPLKGPCSIDVQQNLDYSKVIQYYVACLNFYCSITTSA